MRTPEEPAQFVTFSCPHCGEPWASFREQHPDIHAGAIYTCGDCGGRVIGMVMTPTEYAEQFRVRGLLGLLWRALLQKVKR